MKFNILNTRLGKLEDKIKKELDKSEPNLERIITFVNEYEKSNLETIEKLRRDKIVTSKKISGAIKSTIKMHGPITMNLISSATKRIFGALLDGVKTKTKENRIIEWIKKWIKK